jgi:hypothetical protein
MRRSTASTFLSRATSAPVWQPDRNAQSAMGGKLLKRRPHLPTMTRMTERQARGERRRAEILGAALQVIGERGIDAVTHRAVADVAGMRPGLTTYYFPTIDGLLEAALEQFVADEVRRLRAAQAEIEGEDATP